MHAIYIVSRTLKSISLSLNTYICMIFPLTFLTAIISNNFLGIPICSFKIDILMWKNKSAAIRVSETWDCWDFGPGLNSTFLGNSIWCVYSAFHLIDLVASPLLFFICFIKTCNKAILNWNQQCISLIFYPCSFLTSGSSSYADANQVENSIYRHRRLLCNVHVQSMSIKLHV